ncbi:MAG: TldD/PmbA family protein [Thermoleophilaceae bacterium]|nr:TldD/PmbA family protein [Thermoleophilaceae bacterium]
MSESPLQLAERALKAMSPGDGAQATVIAERSLLLRFARSRPTQSTAIDDVTVELTALRDGHLGSASTNRTDPESLAECARAAEAAAEATARVRGTGEYPGFPAPAPARPHDGFDLRTAALDPGVGGAALRAAFDAAAGHGVEAHGVWSAGDVTTAIASTAGVRASDRVTDAYMKVVCIAPGGRSGYASAAGAGIDAVDPRAVALRAAAKAAVEGEPVRLPPGEYPVVLEAPATAELVSWLGHLAFNGLAYAEEQSALNGRLGTRVAAPCINLSDSPRYGSTLPRSYDFEGVPKAPLPLIQDGVAHRIVHDTRSAALLGDGARSTGHALAPGGSPHGPAPTNLVLVGGGAADEAELCSPIERGVYVTRFWYTNALRPKETLITGVTRDGTFLIEDGRVTRPLADLRFTDSVLGVLERAQALTARTVLWSEGEFYGRRFAHGVVAPALRAASLRFTA